EYLQKPTQTDIEKLYAHHEEKHGFPGMVETLTAQNGLGLNAQLDFAVKSVRVAPDQIHSFC
nr:harbinger transposase-derived protein [Tanacetum cinerariifolium]